MALLGYWASQEQYSMQNLLEFVGQLTVQPENNEEPLLVEAEQLYEKILENITNKVVTNLSDNISFV